MSDRYSRQILLKEIGDSGQQKLHNAHIAVVGCGGLGSIAVPYLAAAGIAKLTLIDGDTPQLSNVHRQVFFDGSEKVSKAEALAQHIQKLNPETVVEVHSNMLNKRNIDEFLREADLVLECTDDMMTKYLVNDYCHINRIPMIYGAIYKFEGYISFFENADDTSIHLRDIFPEPDLDVPTCSEVGVMNTIAGMIGLQQANEALKFVMGIGVCPIGKMITTNCLTNDTFQLKLRKTYTSNLKEIYANTDYSSVSCAVIPELSWDKITDNEDAYQIISILEDHEHVAISEKTLHVPMSVFDDEKLSLEKPVILYCQSGVRSGSLVERIRLKYPNKAVYSLTGGLNGLGK